MSTPPKKKPILTPHWQPWQMEISKDKKPFYLHAHLCVTQCHYKCNGNMGFLLARFVADMESPPNGQVSQNGSKAKAVMKERRRKLLERMLDMLLGLLTRLGAKLSRTLALRMLT